VAITIWAAPFGRRRGLPDTAFPGRRQHRHPDGPKGRKVGIVPVKAPILRQYGKHREGF
jgi:hypothetical protein